jgi:hypothetical protein
MSDLKVKGGKRAGASRGVVFATCLGILLLPLLLVSFVGPLQSLAIPLGVEPIRNVEYVPDDDRAAVEAFLARDDTAEGCWREVPSGRVVRVEGGRVEQFVPGTTTPITQVAAVDVPGIVAEVRALSENECWYATAKLHLVRRSPGTGDLVQLVRIGPGPVSHGNLGSGVRFGALLFLGACAVAAIVARRRVTAEVGLASLLAALVQLLLWFRAIGFDGAFLGGELKVLGDGFEMTTPFGLFVTGLASVYVLAGVGGALIGSLAVDAATQEQACTRCGHRYPSAKLPEKCPACAAPVDRRGVQWAFVVLAMIATVLCVYVLLLHLGGALAIFMQSLPRAMTPAFREAWRGADNGWVGYGSTRGGAGNAGFLIALHTMHYLGYTAVLMFVGPFLLSWRLRRGARPSALALVGVNWIAASLLVAVVIGAVGTAGVFVIIFQTQVYALLAWSAAGVTGAMLGHALRQRSAATMFEEVDG